MIRHAAFLFLIACSFHVALAANPPATSPEGVLPVGADGKPLNLDFETGTLKDWTAEGEAFRGQPIKGDTVAARRGDMKSRHQGNYWIGTYELKGDDPQGTLTSVPFKVTHPWASYLIGGGRWAETCVELVRADTKEVFSRTSGLEEEDMRRVAIDLKPHIGKEIFIRLVDKRSGHWGHLNFDDFRFHSTKPDVPSRPAAPREPDVYKFAGLPPDKAAAAMTVPEGFSVTLFAGEPDIRQPIAFCFDHRGRLWVAEAYSYPIRRPDKEAKDRILIFEDTKGTGTFDKRTVFMEGLNLVSGLEYGFGGVWIGAAPYLMFVPIKEGEDKPAGPPQILLDGWAYQDTHETLNDFRWGPDGWLYGCHGVFTHSRVGKPGTPDKERIPLNAGVWRYHPTKHIFEVFAQGTSNPWGLDFDEHGQAFVEACVIPHLFHIVQGGRYNRQAGDHFNPHTYADIPTIADHLHWEGANQWAANQSSGSKGGGHAHCGLMIYLGGAWPKEYNGQIFIGNLHGHRLNMDVPRTKGSGFVAGHGADFLLANDAWARFINFRYGPDGNVFLLDWYDKQACHSGDVNIWDRDNGRIYKISYRGTKPVKVDLEKLDDKDLVAMVEHPNEWFVRQSRLVLQERAAAGKLGQATRATVALLLRDSDVGSRQRLRYLWLLHAIGGLQGGDGNILFALANADPYVRAWAVQLAAEGLKHSEKVKARLAELARTEKSPIVRMYLASAAQRLADGAGQAMIAGPGALSGHIEDANDPNLPLLIWYAVEAQVTRWEKQDLTRVAPLYADARLPLVREFLVRRVTASEAPGALAVVVGWLDKAADPAEQKLILRNVQIGLKGRRQVGKPAGWDAFVAKADLLNAKDGELRSLAWSLAVTFGDATAFKRLREQAIDTTLDLPTRQAAVASLLDAHDPQFGPVLQRLVTDKALRGTALRGLAAYDDPKTPEIVISAFAELTPAEKRDAVNALAARPAYGKALMEAVATKKILAAEVPAEVVRQLRNLNDPELDKRIAEVWGLVRTTPADRARIIAEWKKKLQAPAPAPDLAQGRALFAKTCQQCHTLYGQGGKVGPDITGSNRGNLDYLLENILDPSAVIPNDYKATLISLKNGRVLTGIIRGETPRSLTVVMANEVLTVPVNEIESRTVSNTSMMPEDLLKPLSDVEVRALIAYLSNPGQTALLATHDNAQDLFNGKDLTGWDGDPKLWSVENGEIVGKSPGIKKNEFLRSQMIATDFRLTLKIKLVPDRENSGVQFRSEALPNGEVKGPQADVGLGWWGKLYEENGRGLIWDKPGDKHVKVDDWNDYEIIAEGSHVRTFINGKACVDLDDPMISRRGLFAFQIHAGGPMEVRFRDIKLEVLPARGK